MRHQCSIVGGFSGSPLISKKTGQIVGLVNTAVDELRWDSKATYDEVKCELNFPCEIRAGGVKELHRDQNYAQFVDKIPACFDSEGRFNIALPDCKLEKPPASHKQ